MLSGCGPRARAPLLLALAAVLACRERPSLTGRFASKDVADRARRVEIAQRYVDPVTPIEDVAFSISYHDNGGGLLPAPSDWSLHLAIRVAPGQAARWTAFYRSEHLASPPAEGLDLSWAAALLRERGWTTGGRPRLFGAFHEVRAVYEEEDLVLILSTTM